MFTTLFWKDVAERALKTFGQTLVATLTAAGVTLSVSGGKAALISAAFAAVLSVASSLGSVALPGGDGASASLVPSIRRQYGRHEAGHPPVPVSQTE